MSKGVQIAFGATLVVILLGWFGWSQVEEGALVYYTNLEELRASGETNSGARVHGFVVEGSIERDLAAKVVRFRVQSTPEGARELVLLANVINESAEAFQTLQRDIDDKVYKASLAVKEERNRLAALMSELPFGVVVCNLDGRILLYNNRARVQFRALSAAP